jgi:hypothetical protein
MRASLATPGTNCKQASLPATSTQLLVSARNGDNLSHRLLHAGTQLLLLLLLL